MAIGAIYKGGHWFPALTDKIKSRLVSYDNTSSGMTSDNVQDAVDELKSSLTEEAQTRSEAISQQATEIAKSKIHNYRNTITTSSDISYGGLVGDWALTFDESYSTTPSVHAQLFNFDESISAVSSYLTVTIINLTTTGCTVRVRQTGYGQTLPSGTILRLDVNVLAR